MQQANLKNVLKRAFVDCWAVFLVLVLKNTFLIHSNIFDLNVIVEFRWLSHVCKLTKAILTVVDDDSYTVWEAVWIYSTIYIVVILCLFTMLLLASIIYTIEYRVYTVLMFSLAIAALFWEVASYESLRLQVAVMFCFIFFSLYKIHRTFTKQNFGSKIMAETGDSMLRFGIVFYLKLLGHLIILFWKSWFIRIYNFKQTSYTQHAIFCVLLVYYMYGEVFLMQATVTHMLSKKVYKDCPSFRYEFIALYFSSSVTAFMKIIFLVTNRLFFMLKIFMSESFVQRYTFFKYLEDDRCHFYYIIFKRISYFEGFSGFRDAFWKGNVKKQIKAINFKGDFLPVILCVFIALKIVLKQYDIIRPYDLIFILMTNAFVILEIFHTYGVVKILVYSKTQNKLDVVDVGFNAKNDQKGQEFVDQVGSKLKMDEYLDHLFFKNQLLDMEKKKFINIGDSTSEMMSQKEK